jgi:predicted NUDIX family NTP pyrophosphohydrolase
MGKKSAGLLVYREAGNRFEVFLVHPGGPLWARKDDGAWSVPKGEFDKGEDPLVAAIREFEEETGVAPTGEAFGVPIPLSSVRQPGGKAVYAWALKGDLDADAVRSNDFTMEWPPKSGRQQVFPEVDRAAWFPLEEAAVKILAGQAPLLEQLRGMLAGS